MIHGHSSITDDRGPLADFAEAVAEGGDVCWLGAGELLVAEPHTARAIFANRDGRLREHSDFFGPVGPRAAQVQIGRDARELLREHVAARATRLPGLVDEHLRAPSAWPDAANWLLYAHLGDALLAPDRPADVRDLVRLIVARGVVASSRGRHSFASRAVFRARLRRGLNAELRARRAQPDRATRDLLDVVLNGADPATTGRQLIDVYVAMVFAVAGSIGFALSWAVWFEARQPSGAAAERIVREALRLGPVAWLFARSPAVAHSLGGVTVTPNQTVTVCTYLVHRHPSHWAAPDAYCRSRTSSTPKTGPAA